MRIAHLTPGTGSFYCGACLRDQTLVRALRERGHEITLVPMYLPPFPEDPAASAGAPIRMGALNLYLQQKLPALRRLPRPVANLLDSPRLLRWLSRREGTTDPAFLGEMTISMLRGEEGRLGHEVEKLGGWFAEQPPFHAVFLSNVMLCSVARVLREHTRAALVCTLQGETPFLDALPEPHGAQAWKMLAERARDVDAFVAVSRHHADVMTERLELPPDRVSVVLNGLDLERAFPDDAFAPPDRPTLGFLARMNEEKGLSLIVEAFLRLRAGPAPTLRLRVAGVEREEDRPLIDELKRRLAEAGLADDVEFLPNLAPEAKREFLRSLTVFSVPARGDESFGLYVLEAMAAGVPVVQPRHAAFPEILEAAGSGVLCEPDDPDALAEAIDGLLRDPEAARSMAERGRAAVRDVFSADRMARDVEKVLEEVLAVERRERP